jgi:predicted small secreted protein
MNISMSGDRQQRQLRQMKHTFTISLAILSLVLASGCKTVHGVGRSAKVQKLPSAAVVDASLRDVPGVGYIFHYPRAAGRPEHISYRSGALSSVIELAHEENGDNTLFLYSYWVNETPSWQVIDETRALMDAVYASLRQHAPDLPPASELKEVLVKPPKR